MLACLAALQSAHADNIARFDPNNRPTQINAAPPEAIDRPALQTAKSAVAMMLSIAAAGDRLIAVGERGYVLLSDDNGKTWYQTPTPTSVTLTSVSFATPQEGWAVGHMGVILHSTDGGSSWSKQLDGIAAAKSMLAAATKQADTAPGNPTATAALKTARQFIEDGPDKPFLSLLVESSRLAIAWGAFGLAFSTTDAGATWVPITDFSDPRGLHVYASARVNGSTYVAGERGLLIRSTDGRNFTVLALPYKGTLFGLLSIPKRSLLVYGLLGTLLRSDDGGDHWNVVGSGINQSLTAGIVLNDGRVVLGCQCARLVVSMDDGRDFPRSLDVSQPVNALVEAQDGAIIVAGPQGLVRVEPSSLAQNP
jgi:photosystem II stability/assembly factor-like uncharacterized protein